jgi:hypothetical protein
LYTLRITHYFFGSSSVLRTESSFLQGFVIQANEGVARIKKNTHKRLVSVNFIHLCLHHSH